MASQIIERIWPTFKSVAPFLDERVVYIPVFREDFRTNRFYHQAFQYGRMVVEALLFIAHATVYFIIAILFPPVLHAPFSLGDLTEIKKRARIAALACFF